MKEKFHIAGIKKILLTWHKHADLLDTPDPAHALYVFGSPDLRGTLDTLRGSRHSFG
jgi:hypothetical protein